MRIMIEGLKVVEPDKAYPCPAEATIEIKSLDDTAAYKALHMLLGETMSQKLLGGVMVNDQDSDL